MDTFLAALLAKTPAHRPRTSRVPRRLRDLTTRYGKVSALLDEAEHAAGSITDPEAKAWALQGVAGAMAAVDPGQAKGIAPTITDPAHKAAVCRRSLARS
ncbi:hypothetical protein [Actinomadura nitritigenes]|uniref:hypothetical protein n=1 Tax=Actinomadura nitritigenes TaxID=134602 RepID=UPI003D8CE3CB